MAGDGPGVCGAAGGGGEAPAPLRLLVLAPDPRLAGGVGQFLRALLAHLSGATTARVLVVGHRPRDRFAASSLLRPLADGACLLWATWAGCYDVLHVNPSMASKSVLRDGMFLLLARLGRVRAVVVFFHGWDQRLARAIGRSPWRRALFRLAFGRADHVFVLAEPFRRQLLALGLDPDRVEVTATMFDGGELGGPHRPERPDRPAGLIFMGRLIVEKGIYELLDAFARLRREFPKLELVVGGDGPELDAFRERVQQMGLESAVHCPGFVSGAAKADWLARAGLFVLPSYREGCPVAMLEAMAMGLPVVASRVGGVPRVIGDGLNGRLLPDVDARTLYRILGELLADEGRLRAMGERNREQAWRLYEAGTATAAIEARYRQLAWPRRRSSQPA